MSEPKQSGTLKELLEQAVEQFKQLTPEQQEDARKNIDEGLTGASYPPPKPPERPN